jgi:glycosyltransferase involved in cell wall biosynthesis
MSVLIAESKTQIECLLDNGFAPEQIAWLPNFTPIRPEHETAGFIRKHYNPKEKIILFVGRASYEKGVHVLIEACQYLKSKCKIIIIAAGPLLDELSAMASKYGGRIEVIPGLSYEETREYYARSSLVIIPSVWLENFCLVGLEAFANMKPVIGSRIGGICDWLRDQETGWFFETGNAKDLAAKIDHALADPEHLREIGRAAYERIRNYYNSEIYVERLMNIYERGLEAFSRGNSQ